MKQILVFTIAFTLSLLAAPSRADEGASVILKNGNSLEGVLRKNDRSGVTLEVDYRNYISVPTEQIAKVEKTETALNRYYEERAKFNVPMLEAQARSGAKLALWAKENRLPAAAGHEARRVLDILDASPELRAGLPEIYSDCRRLLGHFLVNGHWYENMAEANRARGLLPYPSSENPREWISPQEMKFRLEKMKQEAEAKLKEEEMKAKAALENKKLELKRQETLYLFQ